MSRDIAYVPLVPHVNINQYGSDTCY